MIRETIGQILGVIFLFSQGILLSYIIFAKTDIIKRIIYSIILTISLAIILGTILFQLERLNFLNIFVSLILINLLFLFIIFLSKQQYKTNFNKDIGYLTLFSIIGTIWRLLFVKSIKNFGDAYQYAGQYAGETPPNLGFYTGLAIDHSHFVGEKAVNVLFNILGINNQVLNIFLISLVYLGFIYLIFSEFRNKKFAYLGVALMSLGPIEIFHSTLSIISAAALSYISVFSFFLLFKSKDNKIFWLTLLLSIALMFSYYTASMVIILTSFGFIISLFVKNSMEIRPFSKALKKTFLDEKIQSFLIIALIVIFYTFLCSGMATYTLDKSKEFSYTLWVRYKDPTFLGFSAIGWQILFFLICGLTFIITLFVKRNFSDNRDLLLCFIPLLIVSYGFFHTGFITRAFDYFAFLGLLVLQLPLKNDIGFPLVNKSKTNKINISFTIFLIFTFIFMLISSFFVAKDKKIFFETSDKEIEAALWVKNNLTGRVFSDISFVNTLVSKKYHNVTGANDKNLLIYDLFYQKDVSEFLKAINKLNIQLNVDYIALTKKMRENYILMLDVPQKPLINMELYENNLIKVYDNEEVKIFKTELK